jgi:uncharacterized glyoxalase superfamily protein PhnB/uncharacterized protein YndB with AHSA1/START domain
VTVSQTSVRVSVEVPTDPATAFRVFTEEIDAWWQRGPINFYDGGRAAAKRIEPGVGGRYLEIYDEAASDVLVTATITAWEPPGRFVSRSAFDDTETEITFRPTDDGAGTVVTIEQRLVAGGDPTRANLLSGWAGILDWYRRGVDRQERGLPAPGDLPRLSVLLRYDDVAKAAAFLVDAFGFEPRGELPDPARWGGYGELSVGDSMVMLQPSESGEERPGRADHELYVYVDDLDAHLEQARDHGAVIVTEPVTNGDRHYQARDHEGHRWTFAQARPTQRL